MRIMKGLVIAVFFIACLAWPARAEEKGDCAFLGVVTTHIQDELRDQLGLPFGSGLALSFVSPESPAEKADLQRGDIIFKLDDQLLFNPQQLASLVRGHKPEDAVVISVLRKGRQFTLSAALGRKTGVTGGGPPGIMPGGPFGAWGGAFNDEDFQERLNQIEKEVQERLEHAFGGISLPGGGNMMPRSPLMRMRPQHRGPGNNGLKGRDEGGREDSSAEQASMPEDRNSRSIISLSTDSATGLSNGSRVRVLQNSVTKNGVNSFSINITDDEQDISVTCQGSDGRIVVKDRDGNILHDAPWSERASLPEAVRAKIEAVHMNCGDSGPATPVY